MAAFDLSQIDLSQVPSPCYVIDEWQLEQNLKTLKYVQEESGAKILLALKAFSMHGLAPLIMKYLNGTCASGIFEARLGREKFGGEVHTYSAAYRPQDFKSVLDHSDHVVFNSFAQWQRFKKEALTARENKAHLSFGLRINPEHSEGTSPIYDPCSPCSRMGTPIATFKDQNLENIEGLHFHTLCEQDFEPLKRTLDVIEEQFAEFLPHMLWINFGGGHHITRGDYQVDKLIECIKQFQARYDVQVYLEPGEAVALNSGILLTEVLDTHWNHMDLAILDVSATCHMPDILEMPYRPKITGAGEAGEFAYTYRLGGPSCLAGDVIGDYSFPKPLEVGERLMFEDMAIYTMVKNTTFNGIPLPAIAVANSQTGQLSSIREFNYNDFESRLS